MKTFLIVDFFSVSRSTIRYAKGIDSAQMHHHGFWQGSDWQNADCILESGEDYYFNVQTRLSVLPNYNFLL